MDSDIYQCPHCGDVIPNVDGKVFLHKTFRKGDYANFSKGNILRKSTMENIFDLLTIDVKKVPRGVVVQKDKAGQTTLTFKTSKIYWAALGINIFTVYALIEEAVPLYLKLIALAFTVFTLVFFICNLIYNRFAKWQLILNDGKGSFFGGIGRHGRTIAFEYNSDSTVAAVTDEDVGRNVVQGIRYIPYYLSTIPIFIISSLAGQVLEQRYVAKEGITVATNGIQYIFGGSIPRNDVIKYIAAYILQEIEK